MADVSEEEALHEDEVDGKDKELAEKLIKPVY